MRTGSFGTARRAGVGGLTRSIAPNIHFIVLAVFFIAASSAASAYFGYDLEYQLYSTIYYPFILVFGAFFLAVVVVAELIRQRSLRATAGTIVAYVRSGQIQDRALTSLPVVLLIPLVMSAFSSNKMGIPTMVPFYLDPYLVEWDKALHGGIHPWQALEALIPPLGTHLLNFAYNLWLFIAYIFLFIAVFAPAGAFRARIIFSFFAAWIFIGNGMATLLSSVGPCFYGRLYPDQADPYAGLMSSLAQAAESYAVWSLPVQDMLWQSYLDAGMSIGKGISAMPSMHVSVTVLIFLASLRFAPWMRIAAGAFLATILIGSVHLGWHYAVDGYVSIALTVVIWKIAGRLIPEDAAMEAKTAEADLATEAVPEPPSAAL